MVKSLKRHLEGETFNNWSSQLEALSAEFPFRVYYYELLKKNCFQLPDFAKIAAKRWSYEDNREFKQN